MKLRASWLSAVLCTACSSSVLDISDAGFSPDATSESDASIVDASVTVDASVVADGGRWHLDGGLEFVGAFQLASNTTGSTNDYAVGALAHNPVKNTLFLAGHSHQNAIAEFAIPDAGRSSKVEELPVAAIVQNYHAPLAASPTGNPQGMNIITGMLWVNGALLVNAENWYDAAGTATNTTLVIRDADHLEGAIDGYFSLAGATHAAGYMGVLPAPWNTRLHAEYFTGWASNYSIISRYSIGPTLFTFDPQDILKTSAGATGDIATHSSLEYPFAGDHYLGVDALLTERGHAPALWNHLSRGKYGFIVPGSRTFVVIGANGGVNSGIGYKITQDNGNLCGGYCAYSATDVSNYFWLFDLDDVLAANHPWDPRPYAHGTWSLPFDANGAHDVIGASFDGTRSLLYVVLGTAGALGAYDRPPLILVYRVRGP